MSKVSTIYDRLRVVIPTITGFSDKKEITNPYSLEDNNINILREGWGLAIGESTPTPGEYNAFNEERTFNIIVTQEVKYTDHNLDPRITVEKAVLEDSYNLKKEILNNNQLNIPSDIEIILPGGSTGIEFFQEGVARLADGLDAEVNTLR